MSLSVSRTICLLVFACYSNMLNAQIQQNSPPQIWMVAIAHSDHPAPQWKGIRADAGDMWKTGSPWQTVANQVQVAEINAGNVENASDDALGQLFADVKRRKMKLGLAIGPLVRSAQCHSATEAYGNPGETELILKKIQKNGGNLDYVAWDEPFYYGHEDAGGCHETAAQLAQEVVGSVAIVRRIFPNVKIGDIEVTTASAPWANELEQWTIAYQKAVGEPLAFFHADVQWSALAIANLQPLAEKLRQQQIPFGIYYTAGSEGITNDSWEQSAVMNFVQVESAEGIRPDMAIFSSWSRYPSHMLPENQPGTLTHIAFRYLYPKTKVTLAIQSDSITGSIADAYGKPLRNAKITLTAIDVNACLGLSNRHIADTVPVGTVTAVIGIRINTEGSCVCAGNGSATVGTITYREPGTDKQYSIAPAGEIKPGIAPAIRTFVLQPGKTAVINLKQFAVTAGTPFTMDVPMATTANAEKAGYVTVIFLDVAGKGIKRENSWFGPSAQTVTMLTSNDQGKCQQLLPTKLNGSGAELQAYYSGTPGHRATMAALFLPATPAVPAQVKGQQLIWFGVKPDFNELFKNDSTWKAGLQEWSNAAKHIKVVKFNTQFLQAVPDDVLAHIIRYLKQEHIALGLESLAQNWYHENPCGLGLEGYSDPGSPKIIVAKIIKAGGKLDYIAMDEPLFFGHYDDEKNACKSPIANVAERVAVILKIYTAAFPDVIIGDTEPFPAVSSQPNWQADYTTWVNAFKNAVGVPLSFLHLDFNWGDPRMNTATMQAIAKNVAAVTRKNGLKVGVIYNGIGGKNTDAVWMQQARAHIGIIEASGIKPEQVLFESWDKYPSRSLPETDPNALSSLINFYFTFIANR